MSKPFKNQDINQENPAQILQKPPVKDEQTISRITNKTVIKKDNPLISDIMQGFMGMGG